MKAYTEEEVLAAYDKADTMFVPSGRRSFLDELRKEKQVLFTKKELLEVAATVTDRILVHGIFGLYGTELVSEDSLRCQGQLIGFPSSIRIIIERAKAGRKAEEKYQVGATYVNRESGHLYRYTQGGFLQYIIGSGSFGSQRPEGPLEKI